MIDPKEVYTEWERELIEEFRKKNGLPPLGSDWRERIVACPVCKVEHKYSDKYYADRVRRMRTPCMSCQLKGARKHIKHKRKKSP